MRVLSLCAGEKVRRASMAVMYALEYAHGVT